MAASREPLLAEPVKSILDEMTPPNPEAAVGPPKRHGLLARLRGGLRRAASATMEKLTELLQAVSETDLVIRQSEA